MYSLEHIVVDNFIYHIGCEYKRNVVELRAKLCPR